MIDKKARCRLAAGFLILLISACLFPQGKPAPDSVSVLINESVFCGVPISFIVYIMFT
ncbi:hypothetical protein [Aristaeella hokkaidonensis]|uniref:Uncharacterized protein n=1 Tax=Aristaeella hokkaidonensis TaxID=3046382 RepID=A0AC61N7N9_9FIRM|nr:hypothetical protein [Aristaeella hokkaidonensis]QUC67248.1 hypothetical protein JYE49_00580 [Aristaeella hokkaidonensis]